jgi:hypothetical protein
MGVTKRVNWNTDSVPVGQKATILTIDGKVFDVIWKMIDGVPTMFHDNGDILQDEVIAWKDATSISVNRKKCYSCGER